MADHTASPNQAERMAQARVRSVLEDPSSLAIAHVYADAFLDAFGDQRAQAGLEEFRSFLDDVLARNAEFAGLLRSGLNRDAKVSLLTRVLSGQASEMFLNFVRVLARHERLDLLPLIYQQAERRHEVRTGRGRVQVTSAQALPEPVLETIRQTLRAQLPFEPILETTIDPAMLGGLRIRVGDTVYDSSLRKRLKQLRERLRERSLNEIQSGRNRFSYSEGN